MLLLAAVPGGWLGLRIARAWRQGQEVLAIRKIEGCQVTYDGEVSLGFAFGGDRPPLPPSTWSEALLGKNFVHRAGTVELRANRVDEVMPHLERLPYIRRVLVTKADDSPQEQVEAAVDKIKNAMPELETLMLEYDFEIDDNVEGDGV